MAKQENIKNGDSVDMFVQLIGQGSKLLREGNSLAAVDTFKQSLALKEHWQSYQGVGWALLKMQKYPSAVDTFKQSLALHEDWQSYQGLGLALYNMKQYPSAVDAYKQSLALHKDWQSYQGLGWALYNMKQYPSAVDTFKQSLALHEDWQSYQGLGLALYNMKQYPSAVDAYKQSLSLKEDWQSYRVLGWALYNMKQYPSAVDTFKQSLALKEHWQSYQGVGWALLKMQKYPSAVDTFKQSLALKEHWQSYQGVGLALNYMKNYQPAVDAFKQSLALKEDAQSFRGLSLALYKLGKVDQGVKAMRIFYRHHPPHLKIDPFLGASHKVTATRDLIQKIKDDLSKNQFAFHPSFFSETEENDQLQSWKHLIHIHIPKCAGTNFAEPLTHLPTHLNNASNNNKNINRPVSKRRHYLWHGNLGDKCNHDAFILEAFQGKAMNNMQGSFLANHGAKHSIYYQKLLEAGIYARKICLVRDPSQRLYSHIRHIGRGIYSKSDLLNGCLKDCSNLIDRYIYDYNLFDGDKELSYCNPTDYENCKAIDFLDISDDYLISKVKSSFLSAASMPNVVQHNRLNDDKNKAIDADSLGDKDFQDVYKELILRGYLERDKLIDLEYLKGRTKERLVFPEIVNTGVDLHPITFILQNNGNSRSMLTRDFIADPLNAMNF